MFITFTTSILSNIRNVRNVMFNKFVIKFNSIKVFAINLVVAIETPVYRE